MTIQPRLFPFRRSGLAQQRLLLLGVFLTVLPISASAHLVTCAADGDSIATALARLRQSVDPCGESAEILAVLDKVESCSANFYNVCTDTTVPRNVFDRPLSYLGRAAPRAITWNPALRTEVELACNGRTNEPLLRDPTASLLHELVHAAQDCDGLNPGEHELEAVRIENIYRRAVGLCQRAGYGDARLPPSMVVSCPMRPCSCSVPAAPLVPEDGAPAATLSQARPVEFVSETSGDRPLLSPTR